MINLNVRDAFIDLLCIETIKYSLFYYIFTINKIKPYNKDELEMIILNMSKLDALHLMKVSLYLPTYEDVVQFLNVNKKCLNSLDGLKVNPNFMNETSLTRFLEHFTPDTLRTIMNYYNKEVFDQVKCLDIDLCDDFINKVNDEELNQCINKITRISVHDDESSDWLIENALKFNHLRTIEGDINVIIKFLDNFTLHGEQKNVNFPRLIKIVSQSNFAIEFNDELIQKINELKMYLPDQEVCRVVLLTNNHPENKELLKYLSGIEYYYRNVTRNQCKEMSDHLFVTKGNVTLSLTSQLNDLNRILDKSYCTSCILKEDDFEALEERELAVTLAKNCWIMPNCIESLTIQNFTIKTAFNVDMKQLKCLKLVDCEGDEDNNITFINSLDSIEQIIIETSRNVTFGQEICGVKKIMLLNCDTITLHCKCPQIECLLINNSNDITLNDISCVKYITMNQSQNIEFIPFSFKDKIITIYDSSIHYKEEYSPLEYINVNSTEFESLTLDGIELPMKTKEEVLDNKKSMKKFINTSSNIIITDNKIIRIRDIDYDNEADFIFTPTLCNTDLIKSYEYKTVTGTITLPCIYYEVTIPSYTIMSIGIIQPKEYQYEHDMMVGWSENSIGYHSDDGCLYDGEGDGMEYGEAYGMNVHDNNIVGCGFNLKTKEVFFTFNGKKYQTIQSYWRYIASALGLRYFKQLSFNTTGPFMFDLNEELQYCNNANERSLESNRRRRQYDD